MTRLFRTLLAIAVLAGAAPADAQVWRPWHGLGFNPGIQFFGASYDPSAAAVIAAMTTPPSPARAALINDLVVCEKAAGAWSLLDRHFIFAAADAQAANLDWITAGNPVTPTAAPTFTVDRGYTGDGATSYLDTGYNPGGAGTWNYILTSAMQAVWTRTAPTATSQALAGQNAAGGSTMFARNASNQMSGRINSSGSFTFAGSTGQVGLYAMNRSNSGTGVANVQGYINGVQTTTAGGAGSGLINDNLRVLSSGGSYSTLQVTAALFGGSLTSAQHAAVQACLATYMTGVGA